MADEEDHIEAQIEQLGLEGLEAQGYRTLDHEGRAKYLRERSQTELKDKYAREMQIRQGGHITPNPGLPVEPL